MVRKMILLLLLNLMIFPLTKVAYAPGLIDKSWQEHLWEIRWHEKEMQRFVEDMKQSESPDWRAINPIGCMGNFQFAYPTLKYLGYGYITPRAFKKDPDNVFPPDMQLELFYKLIRINEQQLQDEIALYDNQMVDGIRITKSGILAGAHLGGANGVRIFLQSDGRRNFKDRNNTSIRDYMLKFQGYYI